MDVTLVDAVGAGRHIALDVAEQMPAIYRGAFLVGSRPVAGEDPSPDLRIHILHAEEWWQMKSSAEDGLRIALVFVPVQCYQQQIRRQVRVPSQTLAGAEVLDDPFGIVARLVADAAAVVQNPPPPSPPGLDLLSRHRPFSLLQDAEELATSGDEAGASYALFAACDLALSSLVRRRYGPLDVKQRCRRIHAEFPEVHRSFTEFNAASGYAERARAAAAVVAAAYADVGGIVEAFETERVPWRLATRFFGAR
jgi:hypothetical protein